MGFEDDNGENSLSKFDIHSLNCFQRHGGMGCFKDFEEHLITIYEIAHHYMASFCNGQGDILVIMASDKVPYSRRI